MRFIHSPSLEAEESTWLGAHDKRYIPHGMLNFNDKQIISAKEIVLIELEQQVLALVPDTVSWAFVTPEEHRWLKQLKSKRQQSFRLLLRHWPDTAQGDLEEFLSLLFRRGLITIDGQYCLDEDVLKSGHNAYGGNLVELLITEKCNLGCHYCLAGANPNMPAMDGEIARKAIDLAYAMEEAPCFTFEFAGGEPLLKFDLMKELTDYIQTHPQRNGRSVYMAVQTNATLLNDIRAQWFAENDFYVGVSIDGVGKVHDSSRPQVNGKGSFKLVLTGLDCLQNNNVRFGILVVLNRNNIDDAQGLIDFIVESDIHALKINPMAFLGDGREIWNEFGLDCDRNVDYFKHFAELLVQQGHLIQEANLATMLQHWMSKKRTDRCLRGHCEAGETFQTINASGDIYPCGRATQSPDLKLGNVLSETHSLSHPAAKNKYIKQIKTRSPDSLEGCQTCAYRQLCQAGCSVQAWERYDTIRHRTPECSFYKTLYPTLLRWVCFDEVAFTHLNICNYFGAPAKLFSKEYLPQTTLAVC